MSAATTRLGSRPLVVSVAGAVGVLLIHGLLLLPFVLNLSLPSPRRPNITGAGATAFMSAAEPDMTVVFIDEPTPAETPARPQALASRGMTPSDLQLVVLSPDAPPAASVKTLDSNDTQDDATPIEAVEHARLFGRYLGQLQARIERAWMRPRIDIGAPRFSCRVRLQQDRRGDVIGIDLAHCNGTERWRQSLVSAIRSASPLPAPPDASVYADVLWLSFASEGFETAGSTQGFEPETRLANATDRSALESFRQFTNETHNELKSGEKKSPEVVHLTIIGTPTGHSAPGQLPAKPEPTFQPEPESTGPPPQ